MKQHILGRTALSISRMGLGCMGMSEFYGPANDQDSLAVLERAFELGINFFDTADTYGLGHNEQLLNQFLRNKRQQVVVASKFGIVRHSQGDYKRSIDNRPAYVRSACEASLKRLGTDHIDLYYAHRINPDHDIEVMMAELAKLVAEGKIRAIGLSEVSASQLRTAHAIHPVSAVQSEYSLWTRDIEANDLLSTCRQLGVTFVPYSPLGRGFLTGAITDMAQLDKNDFRRLSPRFQDTNMQHNLALVDSVRQLSAQKQCTPAQIALAWVLSGGDDIIPIPGTRKINYLQDNIAALSVNLTAAEHANLNEVFTLDSSAGARYPEEGMKGVS